jgi:DNA-binding IclR family transcriptional regulator
LAAGIVAQNDRLVAAISITLPLKEFTPEQETKVAGLVKEAARKSSLQFGRQRTS